MTRPNLATMIDKLFKDKSGRWTIFQFPNALLGGWIVLTIGSIFLEHSPILQGVTLLQTAVLFTWAYLEAAQGDSYFRKLLGATFLTLIMLSFFR